MELNKKCIEILQYLREQDNFVRIEEMAKVYKLTDRAIRYNIDKIEKFLVKSGFPYLERQHLKGIKLVKTKELEGFIDNFVNSATPYKYVYSKEERFEFMVTKFLQASEPIKVSYFEKMLCISKNTVLKELDFIELWLRDRRISMIRRPKVGITTEGEEIHRRKAIMEVASKSVSTEAMFNYMNNKIAKSKIKTLQLDNLFSQLELDFLDGLIKEAERELDREFSDDTYGNLLTHLSIMIKRIQLNKNIYLPQINMKNLNDTKEYISALNITSKIEKHYEISVPEEETGYIALHLLGAKVLNSGEIYAVNSLECDDLYTVVKTMTEEMEQIYNISFEDSKKKVIDGLLLHLRPSIYRIKYSLKLINPLFNEIKSNYEDLFNNTRYVSRHLEDYIGETVDDQEVSYICLHFGAALENVKASLKNKARVILVCGTGIGTANMVASKIAKEFDVDIVGTVSCRALNSIKMKDFDYIISTVDIPEQDKASYIKINPLLLKKDYEKLKNYLQVKYKAKFNEESELAMVNRLIRIAEKYCDIRDKQQLQYEFMYEIRRSKEYILERRFIYMLNDLLGWESINLEVQCKDWEEAVRAGTSVLLAKQQVEKSYEEAIINNFKELGPYMVVAPGIALCHARPENGVNKLSMSLITLKAPVKFGSDLNDPVKLIITLAAKDNESHLKALSQLMELFMNSEDLNKILNATSKEEVIGIINKYSK